MTNRAVIDQRRVQRVRARLLEMAGDMPSAQGGGGKGGHSDRTGSLAFRHRIDPEDPDYGRLADPARAAAIRLDMLERQILDRAGEGLGVGRLVALLDDLLAEWETRSDWARSTMEAETADAGDDGCASCRRVPDSLGRPLWSPKHDRLDVCLRCHRDLKRIQVRDGHAEDQWVHTAVIRWRDRHGDRRLTDDVLDDLLSGRLVP